MERGKKSKFGWAVLAGVMALFGAGISRGFVIGEFDFGILEDEPGAVDVALSPGDETRDSLFIPSSVEIDGTRYNVTKVRNMGFNKLSTPYIRIPESVRCLGEYAFNRSQLGELDVEGEGFDSIGRNAFYDIKIPRFDCNILPKNNEVMDIGTLCDSQFFYKAQIGELVWPEWQPEILDNFFSGSRIESVSFPPTLRKIGSYAFFGNYTLESISIPDNVIIDYCAFRAVPLLSKLELGKGCYIDSYAFTVNVKIKRLVIPSGCTPDSYSFSCWTDLEEVDFAGDVDFKYADQIFAFSSFRLDQPYFALEGIPDHLYIKISSLINSGPNPLTVIYRTSDPQETTANPFNESTYKKGILYVEKAGVEKARKTYPWSQFKTILPLWGYGGAEGVTPDPTTDADLPEEVYTLDGIRLPGGTENLRPGTYIVRRGADVRKIRI